MIERKKDQSTIGRRLSWLLKYKGRSLRQLSADSGVPYGTLQQYVGDRRKPGADHLTKLAQAGVNLHWLLLGRVEARLEFILGGVEDKLSGPLAADEALARPFLLDAFDAVEEFHRDWVRTHGEPLSILQLLVVVWGVFGFYDNVLDEISDKVVEARAQGRVPEDIATFLLTSPIRKMARDRIEREFKDAFKTKKRADNSATAAKKVSQ